MIGYKDNIQIKTLKDLRVPENRHQHIPKDEIIELTGNKIKNEFPRKLCRLALWNDKNQQTIEIIFNRISLQHKKYR